MRSPTPKPALEPPQPTPTTQITRIRSTKPSDLGSDDEWHMTMGSDSSIEASPRLTDRSAEPSENPADILEAVQWSNDDVDSFVDDAEAPPQPPLDADKLNLKRKTFLPDTPSTPPRLPKSVSFSPLPEPQPRQLSHPVTTPVPQPPAARISSGLSQGYSSNSSDSPPPAERKTTTSARFPFRLKGRRRRAAASSAAAPPPVEQMGPAHQNVESSRRPHSTQSEGIVRLPPNLELFERRPVSSPLGGEGSSVPNDGDTEVYFERSPIVVPSHKMRLARTPALRIRPINKDMSFLECVVEVLKGAKVLKRKNFISAPEVQIWLMPDMQALKFRYFAKKGVEPVTTKLPLMRIRKLKGAERELHLEMMDEKKGLDFEFPNRDSAETWFSGLCCLVPPQATVRSRNRKWDQRELYDPFKDTWNGKPLRAKKRLNDYILLGSIGRGSFGKVKLALSMKNKQFYAVKVLSKAMMRKRFLSLSFESNLQDRESPQFTKENVNEIKVMHGLDHENVMKFVRVFDVFAEDRLYIVLEFLAQGPIMSSSALTGAKPLPEGRARSAFVDVLCGLEYLHRHKVVHRDIKPDNLLGTGSGTVKISDFGAALLYKDDDVSDQEEKRVNNQTTGTPAFTAPELCVSDNSPMCPARCYPADIWSLGATLFYMIYGRAPFLAGNVFEMYETICTQDLQFPETTDGKKSLRELIKMMMVKNPEKRATIEDIVKSPWLTESLDDAEKLAEIKEALRRHAQEKSS